MSAEFNNGYSPAHVIFNSRFRVKMRYIDTVEVEYIENVGMHSTGNSEIDEELALKPIMIYITIAQMAEYKSMGCPMSIVNRKDIVNIYMTIYNHLKDFHEASSKSISFRSIPVEDLNKLSELASDLYRHINPEIDLGGVDVDPSGVYVQSKQKTTVVPWAVDDIFVKHDEQPIDPPNQEDPSNYVEIVRSSKNELKTPPHEEFIKEISSKLTQGNQKWPL